MGGGGGQLSCASGRCCQHFIETLCLQLQGRIDSILQRHAALRCKESGEDRPLGSRYGSEPVGIAACSLLPPILQAL